MQVTIALGSNFRSIVNILEYNVSLTNVPKVNADTKLTLTDFEGRVNIFPRLSIAKGLAAKTATEA